MSETSTTQEFFQDHLVVRHPEGKSEKFPIPEAEGTVVRVGRELDNDIVLTDGRASRHHLEIRRTAGGLQVKDLNSANGTLLNAVRIQPDTWEPLKPGQTVQLGETRIFWEKAASAQSTIAMPVHKPAAAPAPAPVPAPAAAASGRTPVPFWLIGLGAVLVLVAVGVAVLLWGRLGSSQQTAQPPQATEQPQPAAQATPAGRATDSGLAAQTPGGAPTNTPTPAGPQLPIPEVKIISTEVRPFILRGLMSLDKVALRLEVRVQNVGNAAFKVSPGNFMVRTVDNGQVFNESGGTLSDDGLQRLGAINRFTDLNLTPGGSVLESLVFDLGTESYDLELVFQTPDAGPLVLGLGTIHAGRELAMALGTPVAEETLAAAAATPTPEPTPTATRPAVIPAPQVVPRSALVGTIAYPVFNGNDFDIYLGRVDGSGTSFYRAQASQPAFSPDGSRIAFHSWSGDSRGIVTMDVTGGNLTIVSNFVEDQLPTWTADGQDVILLSRRSGGRQSQLIKVDSTTRFDEGTIVGEGEYPTIGATGQLVFKGWGNTAYGLRLASEEMDDIQTITNVDQDTAPALSPDGKQVVFMSRREENWDIYVVNVDGSGLQRLTTDAADDGLPTWSPDGHAIAWVSNRGGPWAVWAMTPDGAGKRQLFTMEGSPDGFVGQDRFVSRGWAEERISWTKAVFE